MSKAAFTFFENWFTTIKMLPKEEQAGLAQAIIDYAFTGETENLTPMQAIALEPMKCSIVARKLGGAPLGNKNNKRGKNQHSTDEDNPSGQPCRTTQKSTRKSTIEDNEIEVEEEVEVKKNITKKIASLGQLEELDLRRHSTFAPWYEKKMKAHVFLTPEFAEEQREALILYCKRKGKTYKDYIAALQDFINRAINARGV